MGAVLDRSEWEERAAVSAFLGNSLLSAMSRESSVGLDEEFWERFPTFGDEAVEEAASECLEAAKRVREEARRSGRDASEICAVEFACLFIGPPAPAVAPWESMCRFGTSCGFGEATFDMRRRLREVGLEMRGENRQYEDHIGVELLLLSVLCTRAGERGGLGECGEREERGEREGASYSASGTASEPRGREEGERSLEVLRFVDERPGAWADRFAEEVSEAAPGGYYAAIARMTEAFLASVRGSLSD